MPISSISRYLRAQDGSVKSQNGVWSKVCTQNDYAKYNDKSCQRLDRYWKIRVHDLLTRSRRSLYTPRGSRGCRFCWRNTYLRRAAHTSEPALIMYTRVNWGEGHNSEKKERRLREETWKIDEGEKDWERDEVAWVAGWSYIKHVHTSSWWTLWCHRIRACCSSFMTCLNQPAVSFDLIWLKPRIDIITELDWHWLWATLLCELHQTSLGHTVPDQVSYRPYLTEISGCVESKKRIFSYINKMTTTHLGVWMLLWLLKLGQALLFTLRTFIHILFISFYIRLLTPLSHHITWIILLLWSHLLTRSWDIY